MLVRVSNVYTLESIFALAPPGQDSGLVLPSSINVAASGRAQGAYEDGELVFRRVGRCEA